MQRTYKPTFDLFDTPAFAQKQLTPVKAALRSYERAKAIGLAYQFSIDDVANLSDKFWNMHRDYMAVTDGSVITLLTIQYNLVAGTLTQYLSERKDLESLLEDILSWKVHAQFCLTELGHGLDIANLETTAELMQSGDICLNTPSLNAAKFMSPTIPAGTPCVAVVWARLKVGTEDRGIRPFIVPLNDGHNMCPGVVAKHLPYRGGGRPVNHALTYFDHVMLPHTAMLGTSEFIPRPLFMASIFRVAVGSIALTTVSISMLLLCVTIGARYSLRRTVLGSSQTPAPIITFRTQQIPIFTALAQAHVLRAFDTWAVTQFRNTEADHRVRHGIAACFKVAAVQLCQAANLSISERCGAQGLFDYNQISGLHADGRGIAIAEGDILVLSIRLATELLLDRYELPQPRDPQSILARHEASLLSEAKNILSRLSSHRSPHFNRLVLPLCQPIVEAVGHRMAYDAAVSVGVPQCLIDLFVVSIMKLDSSWYSEVGGLRRSERYDMEGKAVSEVGTRLEEFIQDLQAEPYTTAPISSEEKWQDFVADLPAYDGGAGSDPALIAPMNPVMLARL